MLFAAVVGLQPGQVFEDLLRPPEFQVLRFCNFLSHQGQVHCQWIGRQHGLHLGSSKSTDRTKADGTY